MMKSLLSLKNGMALTLLLVGCFIPLSFSLAQDADLSDPTPVFKRAEPLGPVIEARPGDSSVLDVFGCVEEALRNNDRLQAERLRADELQGLKKQAMSTGLPTLDLIGDWSRGRDPSFALDSTFGGGGGGMAPPPGSPPWFHDWLDGFGSFIPAADEIPAQTFIKGSVDMNWKINPVQIIGATGAARLAIDQQVLSVTAVEQATAESAVGAYYSIIRAAEKIQAVEAELTNQTELLEIMKMRYELGMSTRLDTLQAAVTLANIQPQLSIAKATLRNEGSRLNALMGRRPETSLRVANEQMVERDPLNENRALELAQIRPELEATALFIDILQKNKQAQVADYRPYLTMHGSYGYVGKTFDSVFDNGHDSWRASVALNIPIFDGMLVRGKVAETEGRIRRSEAELTGRRRDVQVEVLEILANLRMARQVLDAVILNQDRSEEVLDESLLMLQMGKINYLDVLVSESNRAEARSNVIDARYEVLVLTSSLKRAVGFSPLVPLNSIPGLVAEVSR
ncbi:MAG: TolC family protein [Candidatus Krumholzibacteria bacterium]|nr:TolC family protein [Candidatus Krumholzibacteria bacterium]